MEDIPYLYFYRLNLEVTLEIIVFSTRGSLPIRTMYFFVKIELRILNSI